MSPYVDDHRTHDMDTVVVVSDHAAHAGKSRRKALLPLRSPRHKTVTGDAPGIVFQFASPEAVKDNKDDALPQCNIIHYPQPHHHAKADEPKAVAAAPVASPAAATAPAATTAERTDSSESTRSTSPTTAALQQDVTATLVALQNAYVAPATLPEPQQHSPRQQYAHQQAQYAHAAAPHYQPIQPAVLPLQYQQLFAAQAQQQQQQQRAHEQPRAQQQHQQQQHESMFYNFKLSAPFPGQPQQQQQQQPNAYAYSLLSLRNDQPGYYPTGAVMPQQMAFYGLAPMQPMPTLPPGFSHYSGANDATSKDAASMSPQDHEQWSSESDDEAAAVVPGHSAASSSSSSSRRAYDASDFIYGHRFVPSRPRGDRERTRERLPLPKLPRQPRMEPYEKPEPQGKQNSMGGKKRCFSCGTNKTPYWRDGWDGVALCNACGIRYVKYRTKCNNCLYIPRKDEKHLLNCVHCNAPMPVVASPPAGPGTHAVSTA